MAIKKTSPRNSASSGATPLIRRADLATSLTAARKVEREMRRMLTEAGVLSSTPAEVVVAELDRLRDHCPPWVERDAWEAIADSVARWAHSFGTLDVYDALNNAGASDDDLHTRTLPELRRQWMPRMGLEPPARKHDERKDK